VNQEEFKVPAGHAIEAERVRVRASGRVNARAGYLKLRWPALPAGAAHAVSLTT
jgi:hypothetical protein